MLKKITSLILLILLSLPTITTGFDKTKYKLGVYSEFPVTTGIMMNRKINDNYFFSLKYGTAPERYLNALGDGLENFDWWNKAYSKLLTEICTGMPGLELAFGTSSFLNKKDLSASFGVALYTLDYNNYGTEIFNDIFGTNFDESRKLAIKGKLVALNIRLSKTYKIKEKLEIQPGFNIKYINSFYGTAYSELNANDEISYLLNNWLRDYLEGLFLPTLSLQLKYKF